MAILSQGKLKKRRRYIFEQVAAYFDHQLKSLAWGWTWRMMKLHRGWSFLWPKEPTRRRPREGSSNSTRAHEHPHAHALIHALTHTHTPFTQAHARTHARTPSLIYMIEKSLAWNEVPKLWQRKHGRRNENGKADTGGFFYRTPHRSFLVCCKNA